MVFPDRAERRKPGRFRRAEAVCARSHKGQESAACGALRGLIACSAQHQKQEAPLAILTAGSRPQEIGPGSPSPPAAHVRAGASREKNPALCTQPEAEPPKPGAPKNRGRNRSPERTECLRPA